MEEAEILKNVVLHSVATAFANIVFPVPGGPYSNSPFQGDNIPVNNLLLNIEFTLGILMGIQQILLLIV